MSFFQRVSPVTAYRDLRQFLARRQPHQMVFLAAAIGVTAYFLFALAHDSSYAPDYKPTIIYVQQWRLDRTDAEIKAQQAIDQAAKDKRVAAEKAASERNRQALKRLDDKLKAWGI